jgi:hypothetical protein
MGCCRRVGGRGLLKDKPPGDAKMRSGDVGDGLRPTSQTRDVGSTVLCVEKLQVPPLRCALVEMTNQ